MSESRWSDQGSECRYCGRSLPRRHHGSLSRFASECETCATGKTVTVSADPDPRDSAPRSFFPRLASTELEQYQTLTRAFDAEQEAERVTVPDEEREVDYMPIIAKESGGNFKPAPAGTSAAVCCDVVDLGMQKTSYPGTPDKMQHKIRVVWQLADVDPTIGKRPVVSQRYTLSLHEKASLRRDLQSWRGKPFTPAELAGFDVEKVVGAPVFLNVVHSADGQYANIAAIMPLPKGMTPPAIEGYVRDKDRPKVQPEQLEGDHDSHEDHEGNEPFQATDEMVPFAVVLPFLAGLVGFGSLIV